MAASDVAREQLKAATAVTTGKEMSDAQRGQFDILLGFKQQVSGAARQRTTAPRRTSPAAATARPAKRKPQAAAVLISRIQLAIDSLGGGTALAELLGVNKSQPSRWRSGKETPSSDMQRRIIDLDHVVARAQLVWAPAIALDWLRAPNSHLDGAVPLDVLALRGPAEVLDALDAVLSGAYA